MAIEQDFLQRQIRQIAQAIARLTGATADAGALDAALDALDRGYEDLFGMPRALLDRVEEASIAMTLATSDKRAAYAWLLARQAELRELRGEADQAARLRARAERVAALG